MKSLTFYKTLSMLLVIINLGTLAFFYFTAPQKPPRPDTARLAQDIGLTGVNKQKSDALEIQHHKEKRQLMKTNFTLQKQLYAHLDAPEKSAEILSKIHANREETDRMTFEFFRSIAALCTKEQRKKLDKIIDHGLKRITGLPHPPPKK